MRNWAQEQKHQEQKALEATIKRKFDPKIKGIKANLSREQIALQNAKYFKDNHYHIDEIIETYEKRCVEFRRQLDEMEQTMNDVLKSLRD